MGTLRVSITVGDPQGESFRGRIEALVDTGSTYNALPASFLRRLGVAPHERRLFELADGRRVERDIGQTWVRIDGRAAIVPVVFASETPYVASEDEGVVPLLGAVTLEIFGLGVDPLGQRLIPVPGLLG